MTQITDSIIGQMVKALVEEADPEQVILFGSRARGDSYEHSDVDLVVVEADPFGPETQPSQGNDAAPPGPPAVPGSGGCPCLLPG